jgi:hypothetical protein
MSAWTLQGYDTFSHDTYSLPGEYISEAEARAAARARLEVVEESQPSAISGGQGGIQDQVYVVRPDGTSYPYDP